MRSRSLLALLVGIALAWGACGPQQEVEVVVEIESPADGATLAVNIPTQFLARVDMITAWLEPVAFDVQWLSDRQGLLHEGVVTIDTEGTGNVHSVTTSIPPLTPPTLSEGDHQIRFRALLHHPAPAWWPGHELLQAETTITITVANSPPTVEITAPLDGATYCEGQSITFRALARDLNQALEPTSIQWRDNGVDFGVGPVIATSRPPGQHDFSVQVTDDGGLDATDAVQATVRPETHSDCGNLPPTAKILAPADGAVLQAQLKDTTYEADPTPRSGALVDLRAEVNDPEDGLQGVVAVWYSDHHATHLGIGAEITAWLDMTERCSQTHIITLRVTDSDGNEAEDSIRVYLSEVC